MRKQRKVAKEDLKHFNKRWFYDKMAEKGLNLTELAKKVGHHRATVYVKINGVNRLSLADAVAFSRAFDEPLEAVLHHSGISVRSKDTENKLQITSWIDGSSAIHEMKDPEIVVGKKAAYPKAEIAQMRPAGITTLTPFAGALIYFATDKYPLSAKLGKLAIIQVLSGENYLGVAEEDYSQMGHSVFDLTGKTMFKKAALADIKLVLGIEMPV